MVSIVYLTEEVPSVNLQMLAGLFEASSPGAAFLVVAMMVAAGSFLGWVAEAILGVLGVRGAAVPKDEV